jgi:hypothetical protein
VAPFALSALVQNADSPIRRAESLKPAGFVLLLVGLLLAAAGAGFLARGIGLLIERVWMGQQPWPAFLAKRLLQRRRARWDEAQRVYDEAVLQGRPAQAIQTAADRRDAIAPYRPIRPTWIGDQLVGRSELVHEEYSVDLAAAWPRIWLLMSAECREEVRTAYGAFESAAMLSAWGTLYLATGAFWWPSAVLGVAVMLVGYLQARPAIAGFAELVEAAADLHLNALHDAVHRDNGSHEALARAGRDLTVLLRKGR